MIDKGVDINAVDPGGTGENVTFDIIVNSNSKDRAKVEKKQMTKPIAQNTAGSTAPLKPTQLQNKKNRGEQTVISIPKNSNIMASLGDKEVAVRSEHAAKDMDDESTAQNFLNIAKQGDLSPRHIDQVKSDAKGRKKQVKETSTAPTGGVQMRRTLTKSQNQ